MPLKTKRKIQLFGLLALSLILLIFILIITFGFSSQSQSEMKEIVLIGGNPRYLRHTIESFSPDDKVREIESTLITGREDHVAGLLADGRIIIAGGITDTLTMLKSTEFYLPNRKTWINGPDMHFVRAWAAGAVIDNRFYVCSGSRQGKTDTKECEYFDSTTNLWVEIASLNKARWGARAAVHDKTLYIAGGESNVEMESYDENLNKWKLLQPNNKDRTLFGFSAFGDTLTACGGPIMDGSGATCEKYDFEGNKWILIKQTMKQARTSFQMIQFNGKLIALGGTTGKYHTTLASVEFYDQKREKWQWAYSNLTLGRADYAVVVR